MAGQHSGWQPARNTTLAPRRLLALGGFAAKGNDADDQVGVLFGRADQLECGGDGDGWRIGIMQEVFARSTASRIALAWRCHGSSPLRKLSIRQ
jgi:hypothetical protein